MLSSPASPWIRSLPPLPKSLSLVGVPSIVSLPAVPVNVKKNAASRPLWFHTTSRLYSAGCSIGLGLMHVGFFGPHATNLNRCGGEIQQNSCFPRVPFPTRGFHSRLAKFHFQRRAPFSRLGGA